MLSHFFKSYIFDGVKIIDNKTQNINYETLMFLSFNVIYREYPLLYILIYIYARKL